MPEEAKYASTIAETVEASGNFLNNVKNPLFILLVLFIIGFFFTIYLCGNIGYQFLDSQKDIKVELQKQSDMQQNQVNHLEKIYQELSFIEKRL